MVEKIAQDLAKIFHSHGLRLEIDVNHKKTNFLDVTLDLMIGLYYPYKKPNNIIKYINNKSNHPSPILKNIPENVENRLTRNSANEEIFKAAIKPYQEALDSSGFDYQPTPPQNKKNRQRRITWFNPPSFLNVKTYVGKMFLKIIKQCFLQPTNCTRCATKTS